MEKIIFLIEYFWRVWRGLGPGMLPVFPAIGLWHARMAAERAGRRERGSNRECGIGKKG